MVAVFIALVAISGGLVTVLTLLWWPPRDLLLTAACCLGAGAAERLRVKISGDSVGISLSLAVILASLVVIGPGGATLAALSAGAAQAVTRRATRPATRKTLFNAGMYALGAAAAGFAYTSLGGDLRNQVSPRDVAACAAAVAANFLVNWPLLIGIVHMTTGRRLRDLWHEELSWTGASVLVSGLLGFTLGGAYLQFGWAGVVIYVAPLAALRETMRQYTTRVRAQIDELTTAHAAADLANQQLTTANQELDATNQGLLKTLGSVIDARDIYLYGHSVQASKYATEVARLLQLPIDLVREAELGALLHDIGKIGVPEAILNKPARLTAEEYEEVKAHCDIGYELLINLPHFEAVADVVRSHHEHFDGSGYPRGLRGEEIPKAARIVSVVEAVEAMVSDRPYRKGLTAGQVLNELSQGAGSQWDPEVVRVFSGILSKDRQHLAMRNSALEVALERSKLSDLLRESMSEAPTREMTLSVRGVAGTFRSSPEPIFVVAEDFTIVSINPAAERLTGWAEQTLQGRPWSEISTLTEARPDAPHSFAGSRRVRIRASGGEPLELAITAMPLRTTSASYWMILGHAGGAAGGDANLTELTVARTFPVPDIPSFVARDEFEAMTTAALRSGRRPLTLVILGLDGHRAISETFGEEMAEAAVDVLARVTSRVVRSRDVLARWSEDELVLLMHDATTNDAARALYRIEESAPDAAIHLEVPVEFCSGVAQADQDDSFTQMLERADVWLAAEKRSRRAHAPATAESHPAAILRAL